MTEALIVALIAGFAVAALVLARRPGRKHYREMDNLLRTAARPAAPGHAIFISYRRKDTADAVGRLYEHLTETYGKDAVFKDVDVVAAGEDFREALKRGLEGCQIFLCVMGDRWFGDAVPGGPARAIDSAGDYVRIEVETALSRGTLVLPVLVNAMRMPDPAMLPESLRDVCYKHAQPLRPDPDFTGDVQRLYHRIDAHFESASLKKTTAK
jgi:hypothetical protein